MTGLYHSLEVEIPLDQYCCDRLTAVRFLPINLLKSTQYFFVRSRSGSQFLQKLQHRLLGMSSIRERIIKIHPVMEELIQILESPKSYAVLPAQENPAQKSASRADELVEIGRIRFGEFDYSAALRLFNKGVANAPPNSAELAKAYDNRSGLSLALNHYDTCLINVNRALCGPLTDFRGEHAVGRKMWCWEQLAARRHGPSASLGSKKGTNSIRFTGDLPCPGSTVCSRLRIDSIDITPDNLPPRDPIWETKFDNLLIPNVSSKVQIVQNPLNGRLYLLATEDIESGEVLWIQGYFSMVAMRTPVDDRYSHCGYCASWCAALIPCLTCTEEMYCSLHCQKTAYYAYHRTECRLITFLPQPLRESATVRLLIRTFLTGTKQGAGLNKLMDDPEVFKILEKGSNCVGVPYVTNDYLAILNLRWKEVCLYTDSHATNEDRGTHAEGSKVQFRKDFSAIPRGRNDDRDFENIFIDNLEDQFLTEEMKSTFLAIFSALKRIGFFDEKMHTFLTVDRLTDVESFAITLLLQHFLVLKEDHGFVIPILDRPKSGWVLLGSIMDLMHHAYNPNTATIKSRRQILTRTSRPVKAGEELFTKYARVLGSLRSH